MESIVYVWICWREISGSEIEPNWDALAFDWRAVHNLKFVQILRLGHRRLPGTHDLFSYYTKFHVLDLDPHQVEVYLPEYAVF